MDRRFLLFAPVVAIVFVLANGVSRPAGAQVRAEESGLRGSVVRVRTDEIRSGRVVASVIEQYDSKGMIVGRTVIGSEGTEISTARFVADAKSAQLGVHRASTRIRELRDVPEFIELTHKLRLDQAGRVVARDSYGPDGEWVSTVSYRFARGGQMVGLTTWTPTGEVTVEVRAFASDGGLVSRSIESRDTVVQEFCVDSLDEQGNWVERDVTRLAAGATERFRLVREIKYEGGKR